MCHKVQHILPHPSNSSSSPKWWIWLLPYIQIVKITKPWFGLRAHGCIFGWLLMWRLVRWRNQMSILELVPSSNWGMWVLSNINYWIICQKEIWRIPRHVFNLHKWLNSLLSLYFCKTKSKFDKAPNLAHRYRDCPKQSINLLPKRRKYDLENTLSTSQKVSSFSLSQKAHTCV